MPVPMVSLLEQHSHHAYGHHHHTEHEMHPLDDICGWSFEPSVHFVWVGHGKGRYCERGRGHFDYVGPHRGDFEKEQLPADHTCRYISVCLCLVFTALVVTALIHALLEDPPFDCREGLANWQNGWSILKKDWCCENEQLGCPLQPGEVQTTLNPAYIQETEPAVPVWLERWLADMPIGAKFIFTMCVALIVGCGAGAFLFYILVRYCIPPKKSRTELELMAEVNQLLDKAKCSKRGKLLVTLMWDTKEDLDLFLKLPNNLGEISWMNPTPDVAGGGRLDADVTELELRRGKKQPIESIVFDDQSAPPEGDYEIWVKCGEKVLHHDANLTIVKTVNGVREIFHHRMVPGTFEKKITTFTYRQH